MSDRIEAILWRIASFVMFLLVIAFVAWDVLRAAGMAPPVATPHPPARVEQSTIVVPPKNDCVHMPDGIRICDRVPGAKEGAS